MAVVNCGLLGLLAVCVIDLCDFGISVLVCGFGGWWFGVGVLLL